MVKETQVAPYAIISQELLADTIQKARKTPRKRINHNFHELKDVVQRLIIAMEPESYVQPHRHVTPPKYEMFVVIKGRFAIFIFDDAGAILDTIFLGQNENLGVDIKPGCWHSVISLCEGSVFIEAKNGPYDPTSDKDFASWAPSERDKKAADYLAKLTDHARRCAPTGAYK